MKCEMCGNEVERRFKLFIPVKGKEDERISCCGSCKILCEINDSLKVLVKNKKPPVVPAMMQ